MDKIVSRITMIGSEADPSPTVIYRRKQKKKKVTWSGPFERFARRLLEAQRDFSEEALRRQDQSNRRRREGWLIDVPVNLYRSSNKAYNTARKAVPLKLLPKM
jgi:hypothetical protein